MDTLTPAQRSERMSRVRTKNTRPEIIVRRLAWAMGHRYRLHRRDLPGRPDLAFIGKRKAIFVHGCFWHRHPDPACPLARMPKSRQEFWSAKFDANVARDERVGEELRALGWKQLVIWECQLRRLNLVSDRIGSFLREGERDESG